MARAYGASSAQVRLAWPLAQGDRVLTIPGTGSPDRVADDVAAVALRLTEDELRLLDSVPRS